MGGAEGVVVGEVRVKGSGNGKRAVKFFVHRKIWSRLRGSVKAHTRHHITSEAPRTLRRSRHNRTRFLVLRTPLNFVPSVPNHTAQMISTVNAQLAPSTRSSTRDGEIGSSACSLHRPSIRPGLQRYASPETTLWRCPLF
jgi:hypothetical protein